VSRKRKEDGRYTESVDPESVLSVFDTVEGPVVTSGDVAEERGCSTETARRKLRELESRGRLQSRETAGRVVWWREESGEATGVDPTDRFWEIDTGQSGETDTSERVDEILYGEP
jgi:hypothetical protein